MISINLQRLVDLTYISESLTGSLIPKDYLYTSFSIGELSWCPLKVPDKCTGFSK